MNDNVAATEIHHFDQLANEWWDPHGPMATLHQINPVRIAYMRQRCGSLNNLKVADIGCGGGLLGEALARQGARVTGIDLASHAVEVAQKHAAEHTSGAQYHVMAAEALAAEQAGRFDIVCCMEMLEHVPDPSAIVTACAQLCAPDGHVFFSTINRNPKSWAFMIVGAEYALKLVPRGTHDYAQFIRPSELSDWARHAGLDTVDICGMHYNPLLRSATLAPRDVDVNYLMHCRLQPS